MKIEIDTDDIEIFEGYEDYAKEYNNAQDGNRRWGRLYKGDILTQISGESAKKIQEALANPKPDGILKQRRHYSTG
jgi:hypothetical protein